MADVSYFPPATGIVRLGGHSRAELLADLEQQGIRLNELGRQLLLSAAFDILETSRNLATAQLDVGDLGFPHGATMPDMIEAAADRGLCPCPAQLAPYFRLQYVDQPEGCLGQPIYEHRAPPGSITVVSEPLRNDDEFPKGFYLRRIHGELWLRGYCSDAEHLWDPADQVVFWIPACDN